MSEFSKELSLRDQNLLQAAANGWTGERMETVYGIPAAQAIMRVKEMLKSHDIFDMLERKKLLLLSVYRLKEKLEDIEAELDEKNPKVTEAYLKVLRTVSDLLERQGKVSEDEMEAAIKAQSKEIVRIVAAGYESAKRFINENYPGFINLDEVDEIFQNGMREALIND